MSAVLDLYERRERGPTTLELPTAEGTLTITWRWKVDPHELAKARACGHRETPWRQVLDAVSKAIDCERAEVVGPPM
jgi:hypothetical protein